MNTTDLKHFEARLLEERGKVLETLDELDTDVIGKGEGDGDITNFPLHLADEGTDTMAQEKDYLVASSEGQVLYRIDSALRTLYKDPEAYGRCEVCGREISHERLDIIPWATRCVEDERKSEES